MITLTHANAVKQQNTDIKQQVLSLLKWDALEYAEFQELQGYIYLKEEFGTTPFVELLPYQSLFWKWWINHWIKRDADFLNAVGKFNLKVEYLRQAYEVHNSPEVIEFRPQSAILRQSYSVMIGNLIKDAQNG